MADDREKLRERPRKIRALAERGMGGERVNAQRALDALLRQNGLTDADLDSIDEEQKELVWFVYRDSSERDLLIQTVAMVTDVSQPSAYTKTFVKTRHLAFFLSKSESLQVSYAYGMFRKAWATAREELFTAFVWRSEIFAPSERDADSDEDAANAKPLDRARARRILGFMDSMDRVVVRGALPESTHA